MKHIKERVIAGAVIAVIAIIIFLFSGKAFSQQVNNFSIQDGETTWNKSYSFTGSVKELYLVLKSSGSFTSLDTAGNQIFAELRPFDADFKGAGYNSGNTAIYISMSHVNAFAVIELNGSTANVLVKKIVMEQSSTIGKPGDILYFEKGKKTPIEDFSQNKKTEFRSNFAKKDSKIFDHSFHKLFKTIGD